MNGKTVRYGVLAVVLVVVIVAVGFFERERYRALLDTTTTATTTPDNTVATTTGLTAEGDGEGITINPLPTGSSLEAPDTDRAIMIPDFFPTEAATLVRSRIAEVREEIADNPSSFGSWLLLGNLYNQIQDWEGAREIYAYLNATNPNNSITFTNLGNLYHLRLQDFPKAETNFRQAIANNANNETAYRGLHELYRFSYKQDTSLAEDILFEGIAANPESVDLRTLLAGYYAEQGDTVSATKYYTEARDLARARGNNDLADVLQSEINAL